MAKTKNSDPSDHKSTPQKNKRSLMNKLRHPLKYRFQLKIVSTSATDSTGDIDAGDTVGDFSDTPKANSKEEEKAKAKQLKKQKADKKAKQKKAKQKRLNKAKAAKAKAKRTAQAKNKAKGGNGGGRNKTSLSLLIGLLVLLLGGGTATFMLVRSGNSLEKRLEKAEKYVAAQKYDSAVHLYNEIIAEEEIPGEAVVEAYLGISDAYVGSEDLDSAVRKLEAGLSETGDERISDRLYQLAPEKEFETEDAGDADLAMPLPENTPIQFSDKGFDSMIRLALGKSDSETIYQKDLDQVRSLKILGGAYAEAKLAGGDTSGTVAAVVHEYDHFSINGEAIYERGEIRSLDDLAYFHNLTRLSIGYNQINDISGISSAGSLNIVGLYANEITDLSPLKGLDRLQYLYLYNNNIRDLSPLSEMHSLKQLLVQYNDISDLSPLQNLTNLKELFVSHNQITDLSPISGLVSLEQLFVSGNRISDISPIAGLQNLRFFYAQDNQITDISPIARMTSLTDVDFSGNPVADYAPASAVANINKPLGRTPPY